MSEYAKIAKLKEKLRRYKRIRWGALQFFILTMFILGIWVWQTFQIWIFGYRYNLIYAYILIGLIGGIVVFVVFVYCKRLEAQVKYEMEQLAKGRKYLL